MSTNPHLVRIEDNAANGAPARDPEVWDERIDAFNPLFGHTPEPSPVSTQPGFDMAGFLADDHARDLLRFSTAGSVDDGKSTLIGRLLYDTQSVYEDNLRSIEGKGTTAPGVLDLALLTDGLRAEREQGITIDVAYRYFATAKRKFIIADTPGHEQYTRNMATGASTAVARHRAGRRAQGRADPVAPPRLHHRAAGRAARPRRGQQDGPGRTTAKQVFDADPRGLHGLLRRARRPSHRPTSTSSRSAHSPATTSSTPPPPCPGTTDRHCLQLLETVPAADAKSDAAFRFAVQRVLRPNLDFRGFAGQIAAGTVRPGDEIMVLPSRRTSRVKSIVTFDGDLQHAHAPQSVVLTLEDELDISRGDLLVTPGAPAVTTTRFHCLARLDG